MKLNGMWFPQIINREYIYEYIYIYIYIYEKNCGVSF